MQQYNNPLLNPSELPSKPDTTQEKPRSILQRPVGPGMIIAIILGVIILRGWLMEGLIVDGKSMEPTLRDKERLIVLKKHYSNDNPPARGDIVILPAPGDGDVVVKRVVGLPGEAIMIVGSQVSINGKPLNEPYAHSEHISRPLFLQIPAGSVFVMGDNRDNSDDSRDFGPIDVQTIRGRAAFVMWPPPPRLISSSEQAE
jgi:signal peptidase I